MPEMYTAASFQFAFVFRTPYAVLPTYVRACEYEYEGTCTSTGLSDDNMEVYDFP